MFNDELSVVSLHGSELTARGPTQYYMPSLEIETLLCTVCYGPFQLHAPFRPGALNMCVISTPFLGENGSNYNI